MTREGRRRSSPRCSGSPHSDQLSIASSYLNVIPATQPNTAIGAGANVGPGDLTFATAVGSGAYVTRSNSLVLGGVAGVNGGTDTNVGIGNSAPKTKLHVTNGRLYIEANGQGVVMKSPNGSCFELTVSDSGAIAAAGVPCP